METCSAVLPFEPVDEIQWCDHSNKTSSTVLFNGAICFSIFYKMKFEIFQKRFSFAEPLSAVKKNASLYKGLILYTLDRNLLL